MCPAADGAYLSPSLSGGYLVGLPLPPVEYQTTMGDCQAAIRVRALLVSDPCPSDGHPPSDEERGLDKRG